MKTRCLDYTALKIVKKATILKLFENETVRGLFHTRCATYVLKAQIGTDTRVLSLMRAMLMLWLSYKSVISRWDLSSFILMEAY